MDDQMIVEPSPDAEGADSSIQDRPDFGRRDARQIAVYLRNLAARGDFVTIEFGGKQIASQVLHVDLPGLAGKRAGSCDAQLARAHLAATQVEHRSSVRGRPGRLTV